MNPLKIFLSMFFLMITFGLAVEVEVLAAAAKVKKKELAGEKVLDEDAEEAIFERMLPEPSFLPDWPTPRFSFNLTPIVGFGLKRDETEDQHITTVKSEVGLGLGLAGIPIIPDNPGLYLDPYATYAKGNMTAKGTVFGDSYSRSTNFTRSWGGGDLYFYAKFYRHILGISAGRIEHTGDQKYAMRNFNLLNDFGLLILPFLSTHLTLNYLDVFEDKRSQPIFTEKDHWLHGRVAFSFLNSYLDAGPGFTKVDLYSQLFNDWEKYASGYTKYLLALGGAQLFSKVRLDMRAKYVFDAMDEVSGALTATHLPNQSVAEPQNLASMPDDSLETDIFIGARSIIGGLGFGWRYHMLVLNYHAKDNTKREITRDQGYSVTFDLAL